MPNMKEPGDPEPVDRAGPASADSDSTKMANLDSTKMADLLTEKAVLQTSPAQSQCSLHSTTEDAPDKQEALRGGNRSETRCSNKSINSVRSLFDSDVNDSIQVNPVLIITSPSAETDKSIEDLERVHSPVGDGEKVNPSKASSTCSIPHPLTSDRPDEVTSSGHGLDLDLICHSVGSVNSVDTCEMDSKRFEVSASPVVPRTTAPAHDSVQRVNSVKSYQSGSSQGGAPQLLDSQMSVNSVGAYHGTPFATSRSSLRVNIIAEAAAIFPSFASTLSLSEEPSDILRRRMFAGLASNNIEFTEYEKSASYREALDTLDNPAYTDTVKSTDSTASFLRRSVSVPGQYAYKKPESQRRHAREVFEDFFPSKTSIPEKNEDAQDWDASNLEHPDYTDSVQSTSSGAALLKKQAIIISKDGKKLSLGSLQSIPESVTAPIDPRQCKKNLLVLSVSCMLVFAAYMALRNLQSSIIPDPGLALYTLSSVYSSMFVGCIFAPSIIQRLRPRTTMILGISAILVYVSANFYPHYYTLIPSASFAGFALSSVWTANATYILNIAAAYSEATGKLLSTCYAKFNAFFYMFFFISQVIGGIIASSVLMLGMSSSSHVQKHVEISNGSDIYANSTSQYIYTTEVMTHVSHGEEPGKSDNRHVYFNDNTNGDLNENELFDTETFPANDTHNTSDVEHLGNGTAASSLLSTQFCGNKYCSSLSQKVAVPVEQHILYILLIIYAVFISAGLIIMALLLDPLEGEMHSSHKSILQQLTSVLRWFADVKVILLLPLMLYTMVEMSFMFGEFTKAFITCPFGVQLVGYGMVCLSCCSSLSSYVNGKLVPFLGRRVIFTAAGCVHVALVVSLLFWEPTQVGVMFVITGCWGLADAIWFTQVIGLLGILFANNRESAFAGFKMVQALGATMNLTSAKFLCTSTKLYILLGLLVLAMTGYYLLEFKLAKIEKQRKKSIDSICVDVKKEPDTVSV